MKNTIVMISLALMLGACNKDDFSWDLPRNNSFDNNSLTIPYEYINCEDGTGFTGYVDKISSSSDSSWLIGSGYIGSGFTLMGSNYGGYIEFSRNFTKNVKLRFWTLSTNPGYSSRTPEVLIDGINVNTSQIVSSPSSYSDWMQLETEGVILPGDHTITINFTRISTYYQYYIDEIEFWSR